MKKIGVERVIFPERDMGQKLAYSLISHNIIDLIEFSPDYSVVEVVAPPEMTGKSLQDLRIRARYGVNIIALHKKDGSTNISPAATDKVEEGEVMVVVGHNDDLKRLGGL